MSNLVEPAIVIDGVSKAYRLYERPVDRLKELLTAGRRSFHREFRALQDLSLEVPRGSTVGVIGHNGSGKSTLLQMIAGTLQPTQGGVTVNGRLSALLELGAGFNPEFTGRENVFMNGAIMGFSRTEMEARFERIARFAEIGDFMDRPVKTYSSGMFVRLAFAVAISVDPDILLVDEALAVGDAVFQHRCMAKIHELKASGVTIFFVSHDVTAVRNLCDHVILLDHGRLLESGDPDLVISRYISLVTERERQYVERQGGPPLAEQLPSAELQTVTSIPNIDRRHGSGAARFTGVGLFRADGRASAVFESGESLDIRVTLRADRAIAQPLVGFNLADRLGNEISATNNELERLKLPSLAAGDTLTVNFRLQPPVLVPGSYSVSVAINDGTQQAHELCDWIVNAAVFQLTSGTQVLGMCRIPVEIAFATAVEKPVPEQGGVRL